MLHVMATGIVGQDGMGHAMAAQLEGSQGSALVARARLVHPDMQVNARIMGQIDGGERGAVIHRRQPARQELDRDQHPRQHVHQRRLRPVQSHRARRPEDQQ